MTDACAYDEVEYPSLIHPQMHPSRLAAIARMHGVPAAPPRQCRLLEVGCGDGLQLITLAMAYPESTFVGVDLSSAAIARGETMRAKLGLDNLSLVAADLLAWTPGAQPYDYVIAHGFYSWVPGSVRERLLALCDQVLTSSGIAYISYNALPGCHLRRMMWEMMQFHVRDIANPEERTTEARDFIEWLSRETVAKQAFSHALRAETVELLERTEAPVIFHDDLAEFNTPFSISEFMRDADHHSLQFLAEADYAESCIAGVSSAAQKQLLEFARGDIVRQEQYLDYLKGRRFRQTILCRSDVVVRRDLSTPAAADMDAKAQLRPEPGDADLRSREPLRFAMPEGEFMTTDHPAIKAALDRLGTAFPMSIPVAELYAEAPAWDTAPGDSLEALGEAVTKGFYYGLITLLYQPPRYARNAGPLPRLSLLARQQLEAGATLLTSQLPSIVRMDNQLTCELLLLLDGSRDRRQILDDLSQRMASLPPPDGQPALSTDKWREHLVAQVDAGLQRAASLALLMD